MQASGNCMRNCQAIAESTAGVEGAGGTGGHGRASRCGAWLRRSRAAGPGGHSQLQASPDWRPPRGLRGLAGLRDDAPSEARGADGERAGRRHQAATRRQAREHKLRGRQAGSSRYGRRAGSTRRGRRAGGPPPPGTNTQTSKRTQAPRTASRQLAVRTPSGRAERAGRRHQAPTRRTRAYNEAGARRAIQRRGPRPRETVRPGGPP